MAIFAASIRDEFKANAGMSIQDRTLPDCRQNTEAARQEILRRLKTGREAQKKLEGGNFREIDTNQNPFN